jgi:lysozyme
MTTSDIAALRQQLTHHEGLRLKPYRCTAGKLTIGVGRNLEDVGITATEAMQLLDNDITACLTDLRTFPWWGGLNAVRQRALADMRFQMGPAGFRAFKRMLAALAVGDYPAAAAHARDSKWFRQDSPARARTITTMLETGQEPA